MNTKKLIAVLIILTGIFALQMIFVVPYFTEPTKTETAETKKSAPTNPLTPKDQQVEDGIKAYDAGDYEKAKALIVPLAEQGHPKAMNMVGIMIEQGKSYEVDHSKACDWYEKAAEKGYASAQWNFGFCFDLFNERSFDPTRGLSSHKKIYWLTKAAENNHIKAQVYLALHYSERDRDKYLFWGRKAADSGNAVAVTFLSLKKDGHFIKEKPTISQMLCVWVMIGFWSKEFDYCD